MAFLGYYIIVFEECSYGFDMSFANRACWVRHPDARPFEDATVMKHMLAISELDHGTFIQAVTFQFI